MFFSIVLVKITSMQPAEAEKLSMLVTVAFEGTSLKLNIARLDCRYAISTQDMSAIAFSQLHPTGGSLANRCIMENDGGQHHAVDDENIVLSPTGILAARGQVLAQVSATIIIHVKDVAGYRLLLFWACSWQDTIQRHWHGTPAAASICN